MIHGTTLTGPKIASLWGIFQAHVQELFKIAATRFDRAKDTADLVKGRREGNMFQIFGDLEIHVYILYTYIYLVGFPESLGCCG